jgi:predicted PurR-regulated permease PerM
MRASSAAASARLERATSSGSPVSEQPTQAPEIASTYRPPAVDIDTASLVRIAASCLIATVVVAGLYLARPVLLPFALAVLVAFALSPLVSLLGRWRLPRGPSVICAVAFAVLVFASLSLFIGTQLGHLAPDVPRYQATLLQKIATIRDSTARSSMFKSATGAFSKFDHAIQGSAAPALPSLNAANARHPVPVVIRPPDPGALEIFESIVDPLLLPLAKAALVIVFVIFILIQKEDLRDRFISLTGAGDLQRTTRAIDEGAQRLSRYLFLQTAVNTCFGLFIAAGLWLIGIPSPFLWGLIAGIARFVPYVGLPVAAVLPLTLALAVDPGWSMVALTAALMFGTEAVTGQFVEPWLYGRNMGLSAIAVVACAVFWTWIWGPIGLLLSTPLTMCLAIMGRHVDHLKFLDVLLGDRAPLSPEENFYLSMLAGRLDEEAVRAEAVIRENSLTAYFDSVAVKGLALAHADEDRGALDTAGEEKIHATMRRLLDGLADDPLLAESVPFREFDPDPAAEVLCMAGRGELDSAAALLLSTLLGQGGISSRLVPDGMMGAGKFGSTDHETARVVCLSYLAPFNQKSVRAQVRRLRRQLPGVLIIVGFWNDDHTDTSYLDALEAILSDGIATTLADAVSQIAAALKAKKAAAPNPPAATHREPERAEM